MRRYLFPTEGMIEFPSALSLWLVYFKVYELHHGFVARTVLIRNAVILVFDHGSEFVHHPLVCERHSELRTYYSIMIPRSHILPEHVNVRTKWIAERSLRAGSVRFHCVQEAPDFEFWSIFTVSYSLDPYHCPLYACMEKGVENSYFLFSLSALSGSPQPQTTSYVSTLPCPLQGGPERLGSSASAHLVHSSDSFFSKTT